MNNCCKLQVYWRLCLDIESFSLQHVLTEGNLSQIGFDTTPHINRWCNLICVVGCFCSYKVGAFAWYLVYICVLRVVGCWWLLLVVGFWGLVFVCCLFCCFLNQRTLIGLKSNRDNFSIAISRHCHVTLSQRRDSACEEKNHLENKLLLISINFTLRTSHSCLTKMVHYVFQAVPINLLLPHTHKQIFAEGYTSARIQYWESQNPCFFVVKFQVVNFNLQIFRDCFSSVSPQLGGMKWNLEPFFSFVLVQCCSGVCCFFSLFLVGCSILHMPRD